MQEFTINEGPLLLIGLEYLRSLCEDLMKYLYGERMEIFFKPEIRNHRELYSDVLFSPF